VPEFTAVAYAHAQMRHPGALGYQKNINLGRPWQIYATNSRKFSKQKREFLQAKNKKRSSCFRGVLGNNTGFAFDLLHLSRAIEAVLLSWAFRKSCLSPRVFRG